MNRAVIAAVVLACAPVALAGPDWVEHADAGSVLGAAQPVLGDPGTQVNTIFGNLSTGLTEPDYEDMYIITILQPTQFSFDLTDAGFDTRVFLFNITLAGEAFGLLANDNGPDSIGSLLDGEATDGTGARVTQPGIYAIAIAGGGRYPVSRTGAIFNFTSPNEISGPDGPGGTNPHEGWAGPGTSGSYLIMLENIGPVAPAPGSLALGLAAVGLVSRRRR